MALRIPSPKALTKPEAYLAYKAGILSRDELKQNLYNPLNNYEGWLAKWCGLLETYPTNEDGTPQCLTDEEGLLAYLCGVTDRYPASNSRPDDARISAYIRYLVSARYIRPDHPLNREEFYLSIIKTQYIPSGDPSSDITIDGTTKAPFVDVKMYGDTFQQTYTGKNMIGFPTRSYELHDLTFNFDADGTITINGTRSETTATNYNSSVLFNFSAGDITFTIIPISGSFSGANVGYRAVAGNAQAWYQVISSGGSYNQGTITKTAEQVAEITRIELLIGSGSAVFDNFKFKLQVTAGSDHDTNFEPFVGGTPSPNPSYPQDINVVTGTQTISINGTNYPISLGSLKLCNIGTYQDYIYKDGDSWKVHKATGEITYNGTESWNSWYNVGACIGFYNYTLDSTALIGDEASINHALLCSMFSEPTTRVDIVNGNAEGIKQCGGTGRQYLALGINKSRLSDYSTSANAIASLKTWLSVNPTTVYHTLATPTDTTITNQALINQLEALVSGGAENGTTYIKVNATNPNLPGLLYVEAPKYE